MHARTLAALIPGALAALGFTCSIPQSPAPTPRAMCQTDAPSSTAPGWVDDVVHHDGVLYLGGDFTQLREPDGSGPVPRQRVGACHAANGAVLPFAPTVNGRVYVLAVLGPHLYIGGDFTLIDGVSRPRLGRVSLADGTLDQTWAPVPSHRVEALLPSTDGTALYVGGKFSSMNGVARRRLAAISVADATLLPFAPLIEYRGPETTGNVTALALDGDTLYVGGVFTHVNDAARTSLAAVDAATGLVNTPFAPVLEDPNPDFPVVELERVFFFEGWLYACGDWWITNGVGQTERPDPPDPASEVQHQVARFDPATSVHDPAFFPRTDGGIQDCELDGEARLFFIGGHWDFLEGQPHEKLAALRLDSGEVIDEWNTQTNGVRGVDALEAIPGSAIAVGGSFNQSGGEAHDGFVAYDLLGGRS